VSATKVEITYPSTCNGTTAPGSFVQVMIPSTFWANVLPPPFPNQTLTATACYPKL
jgi:hypothetical protein